MPTITVDETERAAAVEHAAPGIHTLDETRREPLWQTVVWDDPVNLMSYVAYVFRRHFGFEDSKAEELMLQVHHRGNAIVAEGSRAAMEMHVEALHEYGLWATLQQRSQ